MKKLFTILSLLIATGAAFAQFEIKGNVRVYDDPDVGYIGAIIYIKGNESKGTVTDFDGNFKLQANSPDEIIVISAMGYAEYEQKIGTKREFKVMLQESFKKLEVVEVYGNKIEKPFSTVSSVTIGGDVFDGLPVPSLDAGLQGRAAGLQITQAGGIAGGAVNVRVRGTGSISSSSEPLYVIDGIPITTGSNGDGGGGVGQSVGYQLNALADINPNEIESMEVLKDAAAAAIYGSRGSNGVIVIKTKRGKAGKTRFNASYYTGISTPTNRVRMLDGQQYLNTTKQAFANSFERVTPPGQFNPETFSPYEYLVFPRYQSIGQFPDSIARSTNNDYMDMLLQTGRSQEASISASGGSEKTTFYISGTFKRDEGVLRGSQFDRYSTRFNLDNQATHRLKIGINSGLTFKSNQLVPSGTFGGAGGFGVAQSTALPIFPIYSAGTNLNQNFPWNPYFNAYGLYSGTNIPLTLNREYANFTSESFRNISSAYGEYKLLDDVYFRSEIGMDFLSQVDYRYLSRYLRESNIVPATPRTSVQDARLNIVNINTNNVVNFKKKIGTDHEIEGTIGTQYQQSLALNNSITVEDLPNDFSKSVSAGNLVIGRSGNESEYRFLSYFARANYVLKHKYLFGASMRADASSRFPTNNRWGYFPAASVGYVISEEDFIKNLTFIDFVKIRGSYGQTGNAAIGNYQAQALYLSGFNYNLNSGTQPKQVFNPNLTWEKSNQLDVTLDVNFFKSRLNNSFTYYNKTTRDMLLDLPVQPSLGLYYDNITQNIGRMRNSGLEYVISTTNIRKMKKVENPITGITTDKKVFEWITEFNFTYNVNRVLDIGGLRPRELSSGPNINTYVGSPLGVFFLPKWAGVDAATGKEQIYDLEGNIITLHDSLYETRNTAEALNLLDSLRQPIFDKQSMPKFFGGFSNKFVWKNFDMDVLITYNYGNWILDDGERRQSYVRGNNNLRESVINDPNGPKLLYSMITREQGFALNDPFSMRNTTRFLHDGSFIRIKTVSIGYTLPQEVISKLKVSSMRIYVTGQNLFTFTRFPGWDPEVMTNLSDAKSRNLGVGITTYDFPQVKTFIAGVSVGF